MKGIRKWRNLYTVLLAVTIFVTAWSVITLMIENALVFGTLSIVMLMLLIKQNRLLYDVSLIWDNRILVVPSAVITIAGDKEERKAEETVISTFGILLGSNIYKWDCEGLDGVRLEAIDIDRGKILLTFGDGTETTRVELLHGMTDKQAVLDVKQRLWHETGVTARISNW